jgi:hypothetical protein
MTYEYSDGNGGVIDEFSNVDSVTILGITTVLTNDITGTVAVVRLSPGEYLKKKESK